MGQGCGGESCTRSLERHKRHAAGGYYDGADCTNYASNCSYAGGIHKDPEGGDGWWRRKIYQHGTYYWDWSVKWVNANEFRQYFKGKSAYSEVGKYSWGDWSGFATPTNYTPMIRGDIVSVNFDCNDNLVTDHTEIGIGVGQSIYTDRGVFDGDLINQHSSERHYAIWHMKDRLPVADMQNYVFRIWHLTNDFTND